MEFSSIEWGSIVTFMTFWLTKFLYISPNAGRTCWPQLSEQSLRLEIGSGCIVPPVCVSGLERGGAEQVNRYILPGFLRDWGVCKRCFDWWWCRYLAVLWFYVVSLLKKLPVQKWLLSVISFLSGRILLPFLKLRESSRCRGDTECLSVMQVVDLSKLKLTIRNITFYLYTIISNWIQFLT